MTKPASVVVIPDNYQSYEISHFCVSPKYRDYLGSLMIPNGLIKDRIEKVASEIIEHFEKQKVQHIIAICVLKGGFKFCVDLIDAMERTIRARGTLIPISTDFVRIRSYSVFNWVSYYFARTLRQLIPLPWLVLMTLQFTRAK